MTTMPLPVSPAALVSWQRVAAGEAIALERVIVAGAALACARVLGAEEVRIGPLALRVSAHDTFAGLVRAVPRVESPELDLAGLHLAVRTDRPALAYDSGAIDATWASDVALLVVELTTLGAEAPDRALLALRSARVAVADGGGATVPRMRVHEAFLEHAARSPDAIAAVDAHRSVTYAELRSRALGVAAQLAACGVRPGDRVGVCLDASTSVPVALLGVLLSGCAYVPLDPESPADRLAYMLHDSGARAVLTERPALARLPAPLPRLIVEDAPSVEGTSAEPGELAYVVYTSGTTGWPKGVAVEHASLAAVVRESAALLDLAPRSRILQHTSLGFDPAGLETFLALATGGTLVHASRETVIAPGRLETLIRTHGAEVWIGTPTLLALVDPGRVPTLGRLLVGGEVMPPHLARRWAPGRRCFNVYGPSEGTVLTTAHRCSGVESRSPPLGRPLPGRRVVVVDESLRPVAPGELGEICLGGLALAREYWSRTALTGERFVQLPAPAPRGRYYRTGDLGRMTSDGAVWFAGRRDRQVKLHGHRIELEEIERALVSLPGVAAAVVTLVDGRLVAHVVGADPEPVDVDVLRAALGHRLPAYMLPHTLVAARDLPRTVNGKVATNELAAEEGVLLDIFRSVLEREEIGVEDDFFALGGDSLDVVHVLTAALEAGLRIEPATFYTERTVARLGAALRGEAATAA